MKEEEIGARLTLVCYSWTVYKIWVADVQCCFLSQTQSREPAIRPEFRLKMAAFRTTFNIFGHFWWGLQETSFSFSGFAFRTLSTLSFYSVNNSTHSQVLKEGPCLSWHSILLLLFWGVGYYSDTLITALGSHIWGAVTHFWVNERKSGPHVSWKQTEDSSRGTKRYCSPLKGVVPQCLGPADVTPIWSALMKISILTATTHDFPVRFSTNRAVSASLKPLAVVFSGSQRWGSAPQRCGCWPAGWYHSMNWSLSNILSLPAPTSPFSSLPKDHVYTCTCTHWPYLCDGNWTFKIHMSICR